MRVESRGSLEVPENIAGRGGRGGETGAAAFAAGFPGNARRACRQHLVGLTRTP